MRVALTNAPDASGHYRIRQPCEALEGERDLVLRPARKGLPLEFHPRTGRFVKCAIQADLIVLQRPMMWFMPDVIRYFQSKGIPVIVEIDDDFHTAAPGNLAFRLNHPKRNPEANWQHLGRCIREADWVTVSTAALAERYGQHGRCTVLTNCVDDHWMKIKPKTIPNTVGWPGSLVNHPDDLGATRGGVAWALKERPDWRFHNVGGLDRLKEIGDQLELEADMQAAMTGTPYKTLALHPYLVSQIDVGIVPLANTAFNAAKSFLKGLEFAALGVPFVASRVPEYLDLAAEGVGVVVPERARSWRSALVRVMDDRGAHAEGLRDKVAEAHLASQNAWRWAEVWRDVAHQGVSAERARKRLRQRRRSLARAA